MPHTHVCSFRRTFLLGCIFFIYFHFFFGTYSRVRLSMTEVWKEYTKWFETGNFTSQSLFEINGWVYGYRKQKTYSVYHRVLRSLKLWLNTVGGNLIWEKLPCSKSLDSWIKHYPNYMAYSQGIQHL